MKTLSDYISEKLIINKSNNSLVKPLSEIISIIYDMISDNYENINYKIDWGHEKLYFKYENFSSLFKHIKYISKDEALNYYKENNITCYIWKIKNNNVIKEKCIYIYKKIDKDHTLTINIEEANNAIEIFFMKKEFQEQFMYGPTGERQYVHITNKDFEFLSDIIINIFKEKSHSSDTLKNFIPLITKV